jgi:glyoxylase-like metal-dependent hydrolase (beta-lactamase superfamily II)
MMQKLWQDLRRGSRGLFKRHGFSFILVITFCVGAGATAAIFSVNNAGGLSTAVAAGAPADQPQNQKAPDSAGDFEIQKLSEGVYAAIRKQPPLFSFDPNNVFIINDDDVIVVDANASLAATKELLSALRKLTGKPVKYVISTHWHDDHIVGNQVWREAFPGVEFIGHASALKDRPTIGAANRRGMLEGGKAYAARLRGLVEQNKSLTGAPITEEERVNYLGDVAWLERALSEAPGVQIILPTLTVEDRLTLHRGDRAIDIRHLGRGHTGADLIVHLPNEGVLITGDLVVWPIPLIGSTSYPAAYSATIEKLLTLPAKIIVPGHGPVMRDQEYIKLQSRLLISLKEQTAAAVARGETLEQTRKSVDLTEFRRLLAGDSTLKRILFGDYVSGAGVAAAFREAAVKQ